MTTVNGNNGIEQHHDHEDQKAEREVIEKTDHP
jgi:hypothetical protein